MDHDQAKIILTAVRDDREIPGGDAALEQALALLESDPDLAAWFADPEDAAFRAELRAVEPPPHLRAAILAGNKTVPFPAPSPRRFPVWLALAAGLLVLLGVASLVLSPRQASQFDAIVADVPRLNELHEHGFSSPSGDLEKVRSWLAERGGAVDFSVPGKLVDLGGVGCEVASVQGTKVTILCFHTGQGRTAHLYVMDRSQLNDPPPSGDPHLRQDGPVAMASWSDGAYSYILAQQGSLDELKRFF